MSAIHHVIFDLDGTLVDSLPGIAFSIDSALRACGFPASRRELAPLIGPPVREILGAVSGAGNSEALDRLERAFRASYDVEGWRRTDCLPGATDMLWNLMTAGIDLWVATNKPALPTGRILSGLNLAGFFREVACRDSRAPRFASKGALLIDLLARHEMRPDECLMVGDTAEDRRAAEAAGIACVIVNGANWGELEAMVGQPGGADFSLRRASAGLTASQSPAPAAMLDKFGGARGSRLEAGCRLKPAPREEPEQRSKLSVEGMAV